MDLAKEIRKALGEVQEELINKVTDHVLEELIEEVNLEFSDGLDDGSPNVRCSLNLDTGDIDACVEATILVEGKAVRISSKSWLGMISKVFDDAYDYADDPKKEFPTYIEAGEQMKNNIDRWIDKMKKEMEK